jgi:hypothetical protein
MITEPLLRCSCLSRNEVDKVEARPLAPYIHPLLILSKVVPRIKYRPHLSAIRDGFT